MCYDGHWSTVCTNRTYTVTGKTAIARVVCRQLGHATYGGKYSESIPLIKLIPDT